MSPPTLRWLVLLALLGCDPVPAAVVPGPSASPPIASAPPPIASASAKPDRFVLPPDNPATTSLHALYTGPARPRAGSREELQVTLENVGSKPETLNLFVLGIPQLALDVFDAEGHRVPPMSPPVPPLQMDTEELAPGAKRSFSVPIQAFSPDLAPGRYSVRLRDDRVHGAPFVFVIE